MVKSCYGFRWFVPLAIVISIAARAPVTAQKVDWQADELANPFPAAATEEQLIEQLRSSNEEGKGMPCKQLAIYGTRAGVPELANLLANKQLASWTRIALEAIPDPSADAALIEAADSLQ